MNILIVGASGNLGSHLSKHLLGSPHRLRLLTHKRALPFDLPQGANAKIIEADLNEPSSLRSACEGVDCIVYLAGVLFSRVPKPFFIGPTPSLCKTSSTQHSPRASENSYW